MLPPGVGVGDGCGPVDVGGAGSVVVIFDGAGVVVKLKAPNWCAWQPTNNTMKAK